MGLLEQIFGQSQSKPPSENEGRIRQFDEFKKALITLSLPATKQKDVIGFGAVADELAEDFHTYYTLAKQGYLDHGFLSENEVAELDEIEGYLDERSGQRDNPFWNDEILDKSEEWNRIREMSINCLKILKLDNLTIEIERKSSTEMAENGDEVMIESTLVNLIEKTNANKPKAN